MARRVLIVSPVAAYPPIPGSPQVSVEGARVLALGRLLQSAGVAVHLLWNPLEGWRTLQQGAMAACWDHLHVPTRVAGGAAPTGEHRLDDCLPPELAGHAAKLHRRWRFDAVLCHFVWLSGVLEGFDGRVLKLLDTHEVFADRRRLREAGLPPTGFSTSVGEETRGLARADIVLATREADAALFRGRGHPDVRILGHLGPRSVHLVRDTGRTPVAAGYVAAAPAGLAALRQVLSTPPPGIRLVVAGAGAADAAPFEKLADPDLFQEAVDVALSPMAGDAMSLEALFGGVPLVATEAAMNGIPAHHALHRLAGVRELGSCLREVRFGLTLRRELAAASRQAAREYANGVRNAARALLSTLNG